MWIQISRYHCPLRLWLVFIFRYSIGKKVVCWKCALEDRRCGQAGGGGGGGGGLSHAELDDMEILEIQNSKSD